MPTAKQVGQAGLQGWRQKVADRISEPVAYRTGADPELVRAAVGAAFVILSVIYVLKTLRELVREG